MNNIYFLAIVLESGMLLTTAHKSLKSAQDKFSERNNDSKLKNASILCVENGVANWIFPKINKQ